VFPNAPPQGGSQITASVGNAVHEAALAVRGKLLALAANDERSPLYGAKEQDITAQNNRLVWKNDSARGEAYSEILKRNNNSAPMEATVESKSPKASSEQSETGDTRGAPQYSSHAFGAHFCEVRVDRNLGIVRVTRFLSVIGAGRVVNLKQAQSQIKGGTVMGIGMALMEGTVVDPIRGWIATSDLASYHVPTHADIAELDVVFVDERDERVNPLGIKGIGEVAIVGVAAAVANAVFHATGQRVRHLPITPDKLLEGV
jgi:xanthine dehydrogenase YagR molybdenum-binding subunit